MHEILSDDIELKREYLFSSSIARSNLIAGYFYRNSGIDKIKEMHVLDNIESTFHVCKWLNNNTPSTTV